MTATAEQKNALEIFQTKWYLSLFHRALEETDDLQEAAAAVDVAMKIQPFPTEDEIGDGKSANALLAHDIFNPRAQGILNRAVQESKKLSAACRRALKAALADPETAGEKLVEIIGRYRIQFARLLSTTQLAALLEGAREVAAKVPRIPVVPITPPPSLPPDKAIKLLDSLRKLDTLPQAEAIYKLPPDHQEFVKRMLQQEGAVPPVPPLPFKLPAPEPGSPEVVLFPTIEAAVEELRSKNVMDRESFDRVDAATRQKAFTVAGVGEQETLTKIRDVLAENVARGIDPKGFADKVLEEFEPGTFLSDAHMETVYRTNIQGGLSDGQMQVLRHPFIRSGFPYAVYDAIHDDRVRENHLALEKLGIGGSNLYRINDPVFQTFRPPWDYQDRCGWTPITVQFAAEKGLAEAQKWLKDGVEPSPPAFVPMPPFRPPASFQRALESMPLSIRLSLEPLSSFEEEKPKPKVDVEPVEAIDMTGDTSPPVDGLTTITHDAKEKNKKPVGRKKGGKQRRKRKPIKAKRRRR
jgi:hypothetical protein